MTTEQITDTSTTELEVSTAQPPAPGADVQKPIPPEGEETPEAQQEATEQQEEKRQSKFQRRLDRQKTARIQAETRAEIAEKRLAELEAQGKPQQGSGEPKREDIDPATGQPYDFEAHLRRVAKWDAKQEALGVVKADRDAQQGKEKQQQANAGSEKLAQNWVEREKSFQAATKDYETVVEPFVAEDGELHSLSKEARMAIVESEAGPALLYFLAQPQNSAVFDSLANLSPMRQVAELGKLELKAAMPAKKTTSAPAPASTTTGGKTASKDLSKMNQEEYEAHRKSQGARWAR